MKDKVKDNIIDLMPHLEAKKQAELLLALQDIRNEAVMLHQGEVLVELHYVLNAERSRMMLTEEEILQVVKIFHMQVADGKTIV